MDDLNWTPPEGAVEVSERSNSSELEWTPPDGAVVVDEKKNPISKVSSPSSSVTSEEKPSPYAPQSIGEIKSNITKSHDLNKSDVVKDRLTKAVLSTDNPKVHDAFINNLSLHGYDKQKLIEKKNEIIEGKKLISQNTKPAYIDPNAQVDDNKRNYDLGRGMLLVGDNDGAIKAMTESLRSLPKDQVKSAVPKSPLIQSGNGTTIENKQETSFDASKDPSNQLYSIGLAYYNKKDNTNAQNFFLQALKQDPKNANAKMALAKIADDQGDKEEYKRLLVDAQKDYAQEALSTQYEAERSSDIEKQKKADEMKLIADGLENFIAGDPEGKMGVLGKLTPWGFVYHNAKEMAEGAAMGLEQVNKGVENMLTGDEMIKGFWQTLSGASTTVFSLSPHVAMINSAIQPINEMAAENPDNKALQAIAAVPEKLFTPAHAIADVLNMSPDKESSWDLFLNVADVVGVMYGGHKYAESKGKAVPIKDVLNDLKLMSNEAVKTADVEKQNQILKQVKSLVDGIDSITMDQLKKQAEKMGKTDVVDAINKVEQTHPEAKLIEENAQIQKELSNPDISDETKKSLTDKFNENKAKIDQIGQNKVDVSVADAAKRTDIDIAREDLKNATTDAGKEAARERLRKLGASEEKLEWTKDDQDEFEMLSSLEQRGSLSDKKKPILNELKQKRDAIQKQSPGGVLQYPQEGIGETRSERGGMEPGVQGAEITSKGEEIPAKANEGEVAKEVAPGKKLFSEPAPEVASVAQSYKDKSGIKSSPGEKIYDLDVEEAKKRADAYEAMKNEPNNPEVKKAYEAMAKETLDQHQHLLDNGYKVEVFEGEGEPYKNSDEMLKDLRENKHLYVLSTEKEFGQNPITEKQRAENPLLRDSGFKDINGKPLLVNDLFRFVHDAFGHGERGNSFGAKGEENAWDVHARMFSPLARRAMTTETRGQNSWVNFGKHLRDENGNIKKVSAKEKPFAEQKMGLLPEWVSELPEEKAKTGAETGKNIEPSFSARALESGTKEEFIEAKKNELREIDELDETFEKEGLYDKLFGELYDKSKGDEGAISKGDSNAKFNAELDQNISSEADHEQVKEAISNVLDNPDYSTSEVVNIEEGLGSEVPTQEIKISSDDKRPEAGLMSKLRIPLNYILGKTIGIGMSDTLMTGEREVDVIDHKTGEVERKTIREEGGIGYPFKSLMDIMNGVHRDKDKIYGWAAVAIKAASAMINAAKKATKITGKELKQHYFEAFGLDKENLTPEQQAQKDRLNKAIPDNKEYGIVGIYKMGDDGIRSNEAYAREAFRQIDLSLNKKEKKLFWKLAEKRLNDLEWLDKDKYKSLINSAKNFNELYDILVGEKSKLPLNVRADVLKLFLSTEDTVSSKDINPIGDLLKSKGITDEGVSRSIEEPVMKGVDKGQLMIIIAIDSESTPVEDINRSRHKNYPFGVEGFPIGVMEETAQFHNLSPEMMDTFVKSSTFETEKSNKGKKSETAVSIYQSSDGKFYSELGAGAKKVIIRDDAGNVVSGKTKEELIGKLSDMGYKVSEEVSKSPYSQKINGSTFNNLLQKAKKGLIQIFADPKASAQQKLVKYLQKAFPSIVVETTQSEFAKMESDLKAQKLFNKNGRAYGFVKDGRIYMDPTYLNNNTPIHEFGHVWNAFAKNYKPEIYKRGVELVTGSKYHDFVLNSAQYQKLIREQFGKDSIVKDKATGKMSINESAKNVDAVKDYVADEALAKAIGDKGELFVNESQRRNFVDWMNTLYKAVKQITGFEDITPEQLRDLPLNKFVDAAVKDILGGKKISDMSSEELADLSKDTGLAKFKAAAKKVAEKAKKAVDLISGTPKEKYMTDDGEGNYVFYHYSAEDLTRKGINPEKFGKNLATGRDERPAVPQSFYYTEHDALEPNVPHDFGHAVRIPKDKVYPFNEDPLNLLPEAEKLFRKENPNRAFDLNNQVAYVDKVARGLGYKMTVADWNIKGRKALRAQSGEAFKPELATRTVPGTLNQTQDFGAMIKSNRYKRNLGQSAKTIADNIRKGKLGGKGPKMSLPLFEQAWDGSLEVVAKAIEAGGSVAEAIEKGIEYLKNTDYYKGLSDRLKASLEEDLRDDLNSKIPAEAKGTAEMFDALDKMREDISNGEGNRKLKKREIQQYLENNPEIAYIDKNFSLITKQLETLGELKKSSAECP